MSDFNEAVQITLKHEGGFVDNPNDSGGATNFGITQFDMPDHDIKNITPADAIEYYREHYWKPRYSQIVDQGIANKLFDMGVLFGVAEAVYLLQRTLNFLPDKWTKIFDQDTLLAANEPAADLIKRYQMHLSAHVTNLVSADPKKRVFQLGWENRINS